MLLRKYVYIYAWLLVILLVFTTDIGIAQSNTSERLCYKLKKRLEKWDNPFKSWNYLGEANIDSVSVIEEKHQIQLFFSKPLSYLPVREGDDEKMKLSVMKRLGHRFRRYIIEIYTDNYLFSELVPNVFRKEMALDRKRIYSCTEKRIPIVRRKDGFTPMLGLYNCNIALWHSHGYYYEAKLDRWEWQRARLFGTVEDMSIMSYVLYYLLPMLENAGANVFLPGERDFQTNEVIVDNDKSAGTSAMILSPGLVYKKDRCGFVMKDTLFVGDHPFQSGTSFRYNTSDNSNGKVTYLPDIPEKGKYAVYISYVRHLDNLSNVKYTVKHKGGKTEFFYREPVNRMGRGLGEL